MISRLSASISTTHPSRQIHNYTHTHRHAHICKNSYLQYLSIVWSIVSVEKFSCALSVFPEGGAVQGVSTGFKPSGMVSFKVLPPQSTNGHLVEVTELKQELDRSGAAAHHRCVVSNTPILPQGVWTNNTHLMKPESHTACIAFSDMFTFQSDRLNNQINAHYI